MTSNEKAVLIVSNRDDPHADVLIPALNSLNVPVIRWHPNEVLEDSQIEFTRGVAKVWIKSSGLSFNSESIRSCWYRRPKNIGTINWKVPATQHELAVQESSALVQGVLGAIDCVWYSRPAALRRAGVKMLQLCAAQNLGFDIPPYCISTDREILSTFLRSHKDIVVKPLNERTTAFTKDGEEQLFRVQRLDAKALDLELTQSGHGPIYLQEFIERKYDVRLTAFGREVYPVAIFQPGDGSALDDWRTKTAELEHAVISCPPIIEAQVQNYLKHFGLNFGAFDFVVDKSDRWWFLECNPNGQWLWMQYKANLDLVQAFALHLACKRPALVEK